MLPKSELETALKRRRDERASKVGAECSTSPRDNFDIGMISYKAGHDSLLPLLLDAHAVLTKYAQGCRHGSYECFCTAEASKLLAKLEKELGT